MEISYHACAHVKGFSRDFFDAAKANCILTNLLAARQAGMVFDPSSIETKIYAVDVDSKTNSLILPRGYPFQNFKECADATIIDHRLSVPAVFPKFRRTLTEAQEATLSEVMEHKDDLCGGYLIIKPVSTGKTTLAMALAAKLKQKTLVIVDANIIMQGWLNDAAECFRIPKEAIGIIRGKTCRIGKYLTIAMVQTLHSQRHTLTPKLLNEFGTVILDEAHVSSAKTIYNILSRFPARHRIGITATKTRKDGLHKLFHLLFGGIFHCEDVSETDTETSMAIKEVRIINTGYLSPSNPSLDISAFHKDLMNSHRRNRLIAEHVAYEMMLGNTPLVVVHLREHAEIMKRAILEQLPMDGDRIKIALGGTGAKGLAQANELIEGFKEGWYKCLIATVKYITKGASINKLNRLFVTVPFGFHENLEQLIGRVKRRAPNKRPPIIYNILDPHPWTLRVYQRHHIKAFENQKIKVIKTFRRTLDAANQERQWRKLQAKWKKAD